MSLKTECIDMFVLIFRGNTDYEDCQIEEDTGSFLCPKEDYKDTDLLDNCYACPLKNDCQKEFVKVDLQLFVPYFAGDEDGGIININFKQKPRNEQYRKSINYINSRRQLMDLMYKLKQRVDYYKTAYAEYAKRLEEYKRYIVEFTDTITSDFSIFSSINKNMIPVVFCSNYRKDQDWNKKTVTVGDFQNNGIQSIIHIYSSWDNDKEDVKSRIRHEIIHYLLWCVNPFGTWNKDNSCIFHYFCNVYDAGAYEEMDDDNKMIYEKLEKSSKQYVNDFLQECLDAKRGEGN
jgi:hypothetical protein